MQEKKITVASAQIPSNNFCATLISLTPFVENPFLPSHPLNAPNKKKTQMLQNDKNAPVNGYSS